MLILLLDSYDIVIIFEDGFLNGGFGEKIVRFFGFINMKVFNFGVNKEFIDSVFLNELYKRYYLIVD